MTIEEITEKLDEVLEKQLHPKTDPITLEAPQVCEEDEIMKEFERETGKNAVWRGKTTKGYVEWKKEKGYE